MTMKQKYEKTKAEEKARLANIARIRGIQKKNQGKTSVIKIGKSYVDVLA